MFEKLGQHCNLLVILYLARRQRCGLRCTTNLIFWWELLCHHAEKWYQFHSNVVSLQPTYDITSKILSVLQRDDINSRVILYYYNQLVILHLTYYLDIALSGNIQHCSGVVRVSDLVSCRQLTRILQLFGHHTEGWYQFGSNLASLWQTDDITGQILVGPTSI